MQQQRPHQSQLHPNTDTETKREKDARRQVQNAEEQTK